MHLSVVCRWWLALLATGILPFLHAATPAGFFFSPDDNCHCFRAGAGSLSVALEPQTIKVNGIEIRHQGANPSAVPLPAQATGVARFYNGAERTRVTPLLQSVHYPNLYPGITMQFSYQGPDVKADYLLDPGADPRLIRFGFYPADGVWLENGELLIRSAGTLLRQKRITAFQPGGGQVAASYLVATDGTVSFDVGPYDRSLPLVIDPYVVGSSSVGGSRIDSVTALSSIPGSLFVAGKTESTTLNPGNLSRATDNVRSFVLRINTSTGAVQYATWFGGTGSDEILSIAADSGGNAYITGITVSDGLATAGAAQAARGGGTDVFVARLDPQGALSFCTYLGGSGSDRGRGIAAGSDGSVWVAGSTDSPNFPTRSPFQGTSGGGSDAFLAKYSNTGVLQFATFLGGAGNDGATAIAVDTAGDAYITGATESWNFPLVNPVQSILGGGQDAFAAKLSSDGRTLRYSTFLGGSNGSDALPETGNAILVDSLGSAYITGTTSSANFPVAGAIQAFGGGTDAFVARLHPAGKPLLFSSFYGGGGNDFGLAMAFSLTDGGVYFGGQTSSDAMPEIQNWQSGGGNIDGFVARLSPAYELVLSGKVGGIENDAVTAMASVPAGVFVGGQTGSSLFLPGFYGALDGFVLRLDEPPASVSITGAAAGITLQVSGTGCAPGAYTTPAQVSWTMGSNCTVTFPAVQTSGSARFRFTKWSDGPTANSRSFAVTQPTLSLSGEFSIEYLLTASIQPANSGSVTLAPASVDGYYAAGSTVQVTAAPASGQSFTGWTGDLTVTPATASLSMTTGRSITANFIESVTVPGSITPAAGSGAVQTFSAVYTNPVSASQISIAYLLINSGLNGTGACFLEYTKASNSFRLLNDAGTAWSSTLSNSACTVRAPSAATNARNLTLTLPVSFPGTFAGARNVFAIVYDTGGFSKGWKLLGNWTVPAPAPPSSVSVSPSTGNGQQAALTALFSDDNGASDINLAYVLINNALNGSTACFIQYSRVADTFSLLNDAGNSWSVIPSGASVSNSSCTLRAPAASATDYNLALNLNLTFADGFAGPRNVYLITYDNEGTTRGWQTAGVWTVSTPVPPKSVSASLSGSGASSTVTAVYADDNGSSDIRIGYILIGSTLNGANACFIEYTRATSSFRLLNDAGDTWSTPIAAGSGTLSNSSCTLRAPASAATGAAVTLTLPLSFSSGAGVRNAYMLVYDNENGTSGWQTMGTWNVLAPSPPRVISLSPSAGTGTSATFSTAFADDNGASDITLTYLLINSSLNGSNACFVEYNRTSNSFRVLNDAGTVWASAIAGSASNGRCSVTTPSVSSAGNSLTVSIPVKFTSLVTGNQNVYLLAYDSTGATSGWQAAGTWNRPIASQ